MKKLGLIGILVIIVAAAIFWLAYLSPLQQKQKREQALLLVQEEKFSEALKQLAPFDDSGDEEILWARVRCLESLRQDPSQRQQIWEKLTQSQNSNLQQEALYMLGKNMVEGKDPQQGIKQLDNLLRLYPNSAFKAPAQLAAGDGAAKLKDRARARTYYQAALKGRLPAAAARQARIKLGQQNIEELLAGTDTFTETYRVRSGDSLSAIAGRFKTTAELLSRINGARGARLKIGEFLRVPKKQFSAVAAKESNLLTLLWDGDFMAVFPVGTGRNNCSPEGEFEITTKLIDPVWYSDEGEIPPGDSRNILGNRWLGFNDPYASYGIHGTTQPETIGTQSSSGCIRMLNRDVELIFDLLPRGTKVTIVP